MLLFPSYPAAEPAGRFQQGWAPVLVGLGLIAESGERQRPLGTGTYDTKVKIKNKIRRYLGFLNLLHPQLQRLERIWTANMVHGWVAVREDLLQSCPQLKLCTEL